MSELIIYTDGACSGNGKEDAKAGWAYVVLNEKDEIVAEDNNGIEKGTNNIGELTAIFKALEYINSLDLKTITHVTLFSDSSYCLNGILDWSKNWKKNDWWRDSKKTKELKNRDLWKNLDAEIEKCKITLQFEKVKGHSGDKWNDYVDKAAVQHTH